MRVTRRRPRLVVAVAMANKTARIACSRLIAFANSGAFSQVAPMRECTSRRKRPRCRAVDCGWRKVHSARKVA
jgi:hypothetical protein